MDCNPQFGKGSFQIIPLLTMLKENTASYNVICEKWEEFGYSLFLNEEEINSLKTMLKSGELALDNLPRQMLRTWKDAQRDHANLDVLCEALNDIKLYDLAGSIHEKFGGCANVNFPPPSKRTRLTDSVTEDSYYGQDPWTAFEDSQDSVETVPNGDGDTSFSLFHAMKDRYYRVERIMEIIKDDGETAGDFGLINEEDQHGCTPLWHLMQFKDFDEELLTCFFTKGADFNAIHEKTGNSVLFEAISSRKKAKIIHEILHCGGNPNHVNTSKRNALHLSARYAHNSALEILVTKCRDVNDVDKDYHTPLHLLFSEEDLDYQKCLEILLRQSADFDIKCNHGCIPLEKWIGNATSRTNPFPTLVTVMESLPFTAEITNMALTITVRKMETLKKFLPSTINDKPRDMVEFIKFMVQEKVGKLRLRSEEKWNMKNWEEFLSRFEKGNFLNELKSLGFGELAVSDQLISVRGKGIGMLLLEGWESSLCVPIEMLLVSLLACKDYVSFVELCKIVSEFCETG